MSSEDPPPDDETPPARPLSVEQLKDQLKNQAREETARSSSSSGEGTPPSALAALPGASRARSPVHTIERIKRMMVEGKWVRGKSSKALAEELGVSPDHARSLATEASRQLLSTQDGLLEIQSKTVEFQQSVAREALQLARQPRGDKRLYRTAVLAADKAAETAGVKAAQNQVARIQIGVFTDARGELRPEALAHEPVVEGAYRRALEAVLAGYPMLLAAVYDRVAEELDPGGGDL